MLTSTLSYGQEVAFGVGFDFFNIPEFKSGIRHSSQSISCALKYRLLDTYKIGIRYRYISITANSPWPKGDNPMIHNFDPSEPKVFHYDEFDKGFFSFGRSDINWGLHSQLLSVFVEKEYLLMDKFTLSFSLGTGVELFKENGLKVIAHNSELTYPDKTKAIVDAQIYNTFSAFYYYVSSSLSVGYFLTEKTSIGIGAEFELMLEGFGFLPIEICIRHSFF